MTTSAIISRNNAAVQDLLDAIAQSEEVVIDDTPTFDEARYHVLPDMDLSDAANYHILALYSPQYRALQLTKFIPNLIVALAEDPGNTAIQRELAERVIIAAS